VLLHNAPHRRASTPVYPSPGFVAPQRAPGRRMAHTRGTRSLPPTLNSQIDHGVSVRGFAESPSATATYRSVVAREPSGAFGSFDAYAPARRTYAGNDGTCPLA